MIAPSDAALRILVVDDSVDRAEVLALALIAKGYKTPVAFDALAAPGSLAVILHRGS